MKRSLKKLLNPNGIIYIEVPDANRYSNYYVVPFYYFDCEHINHFDINSLKNLFEDNEFKCSNRGSGQTMHFGSNSNGTPRVLKIWMPKLRE